MTVSETTLAVWAVVCPFAAALLLGCCPPLRRRGHLAALVSLVAVAGSLLSAVRLLAWLWAWSTVHLPGGPGIPGPFRGLPLAREVEAAVAWLPRHGPVPLATVGVLVDPLAASMAALVALVAFLVQLYSLGYLAGERPASLGRYYLYHSLFAFSMLGLVFAPNLLQLFVFWELVGLCSYLLIGFHADRPAAARAAVKAFWTTRLGDLGFVVGLVVLWGQTGEFGFRVLEERVARGEVPGAVLAVALVLVYCGAMGKSAQFPLHVWLPDAMEGPTPVSALIHAATMVAAGVYLVARAYPLFLAVPATLTLVAWVGALTALLAATLALVQTDIKRVLAYSTVSQLGYMMAALGAGGAAGGVHRLESLAAGVLHLLTHGFFKALLFLAAGAVIHAVGSNDLRAMGRLGRAMPGTALAFLAGTLALAGVPPLSGWISKEAVLAAVWTAPGLVLPFLMLLLTVFLTAVYMGRATVLAFFGPRRAGGHPHDPPPVMAAPLWVLTVGAVTAGALAAERWPVPFPAFLAADRAVGLPHGPAWLPPLSAALAVLGLGTAWAVYQRGLADPVRLGRAWGPLRTAAEAGFWVDDVYLWAYRRGLLVLSGAIGWVDRYLVDGVVNLASAWTLRAGAALRRVQTGHAQDYLYGVAAGLLLLVALWAAR